MRVQLPSRAFASKTPMNTDRLRIAQVAPLWTRIPPATYGGIELLMKLLIDELAARGHEVTLFASADCDTQGALHPVCDASLCDLIARGEAYMFEYYASAAMAEALRRQGEFDVLHFHLSPSWLPLSVLAAESSLWTMHTSPHRDDEWAMQRYPEIAVAGISAHQMRAAALRLGREFPTAYNGIDFDAYEPSYEPGQYLAFLGRMSASKNPLDAIRIARAVEMPIVLAGQPQSAEEKRYFEQEIVPLIDDDEVRWIGPVNHLQKNELLRNAAALLFPIQWDEPFGLVMIEAMACGTPVVAHRRGSVGEVVDPGLTGYHSAMIDGLAPLVAETCALDRKIVREHARSRFSHLAMVDTYLTLYRQLLEKKVSKAAR